MLRSKALKSLPKRLMSEDCGCPVRPNEEVSLVHRVFHLVVRFVLFKIYYPVEGFILTSKERLGRSLAWAKFTYYNYDFDFTYVYSVMAFKLRRLEKCLTNGYAIQEDEDMAALREAIEICDRLHVNDYDDKYHEEHNKKWGEMPKWDSVPEDLDKNGKPLTYRVIFKDRANVKTEEDKKQETKEFLECYEKGEQDRLKDIDRLAELLKKHSISWWD